jgi:hypothetical protein
MSDHDHDDHRPDTQARPRLEDDREHLAKVVEAIYGPPRDTEEEAERVLPGISREHRESMEADWRQWVLEHPKPADWKQREEEYERELQETRARAQVRRRLLKEWAGALRREARYERLRIAGGADEGWLFVSEWMASRQRVRRYPAIWVKATNNPGEPEQLRIEIVGRGGKTLASHAFRLDQCDPVRVLTKVLDHVYRKILCEPE